MKLFITFPKINIGMEYMKRICKDIFSVAGAVQETYLSDIRRSGH